MALHLTLAGVFGLALCMTQTEAARGDALLQRVYGVGEDPRGIAVGDFNQDGLPDLVVSSNGGEYLSILLGNDRGSFDPEVRVPGTYGHFDVVVADFDGDGVEDVAARQISGVSVWKGNGDGSFGERVLYSGFTPVNYSWSIAVADFNLDGRSDIVVGGDPIKLLLSNGDGLFDVVGLSEGGTSHYVLAGDFNGDGIADFTDGSRVWIRVGGLAPEFTIVASPTVGTAAVAFDFDHDGHLDLATAAGDVALYLGRGDGRFAPAVWYPTPFTAREIVLANMNDDHAPDLVVSATDFHAPQAVVLYSNDDGTFSEAISYPAPLFGGPIVSGDFSGDGRDDVAFASRFGTPSFEFEAKALTEPLSLAFVMEGAPGGGFVTERLKRYAIGEGPSSAIVSADLNGDGQPDLATAYKDSHDVSLLSGNPDGSFTLLDSHPVGTGPVALAEGFFDDGAVPDLAVANAGSQDISILLGNGDGSFVSGPVLPLASVPTALVQADLNGDGRHDLATANAGSNDISVLLALAGGGFSEPVSFAAGVTPVALAVADLNGSGHPDLVVANQGSGDLSILLGNGGGSFGTETRFTSPGGPRHLRALRVSDMDGDGLLDVIASSRAEPHIEIFPGDGAGGLTAPSPLYLGTRTVDFVVVDLDGDALPDLAVTHNSTSVMSVSVGIAGGFEARQEFVGEHDGRIVADDFNQDGLPDLALISPGADRITIHLNQLPILVQFRSDKSALTWPRLLGTDSYNIYRGDLADLYDQDGDGLPDAGYGNCRNHLDPDTTDTVFVDDEIPFPGEGYFYLMARVGPHGETDLGSTSSGQPRVPSVACP